MPKLALLILGALIVGFVIYRQRELFMISVREGRVLVVRGRVPGGFRTDVAELAARHGHARATIRAMRDPAGARLVMSGDLDEGHKQRLRNVFALYPASKLRTAPTIARPSLGQILGITWLAWLFEGRNRS